MDGMQAQGCALTTDCSEDRTNAATPSQSPSVVPTADGSELDPWERLIWKSERDACAPQIETAIESPKSSIEDQFRSVAPVERLDPSFIRPWGPYDRNGVIFRPVGEQASKGQSPNTSRPIGAGAETAEVVAPHGAEPDSNVGEKSTAAKNQEFWKSKLDEKARAHSEQRATIVKHRRELLDKLKQLSIKAKAGDDAAISEIHHLLDGDEDFWRSYGDAEAYTESQLIQAIAGGSIAIEESIRRNVSEMKRSLLGEARAPIETMAAGRVVACWLFLQFVDRGATAAVQQGSRAHELGKLQESAERRYQMSLKTLKLVRGLGNQPTRLAKQSASPSPGQSDAANVGSTVAPGESVTTETHPAGDTETGDN